MGYYLNSTQVHPHHQADVFWEVRDDFMDRIENLLTRDLYKEL